MKLWTKYKSALFWLAVFLTLFSFLQRFYEYHFYYIEQNQLFQNTWQYIKEHLFYPGGLASIISGFLVQFFIVPYAGAGITSGLLFVIALLTYNIVKKISLSTDSYIISLFPAISLMLIHFDTNYLLTGTIAFILMLVSWLFCLSIKNFTWRSATHVLITVILFLVAGPIHMLYALSVTIFELWNNVSRKYFVLLIIPEAFLVGFCSVRFSIYETLRLALLPNGYFFNHAIPGNHVYFSWLAFLLVIIFACFYGKQKNISKKGRTMIMAIPSILLAIFCWWGIPRYGDRQSTILKGLDYYARTEQWDKTLKLCKGRPLVNYLYINYVNIALGQKGELADHMFSYDQAGIEGLMISWDMGAFSSMVLSDVYFTMNNISLSQKMAFEAFVSNESPRMLKRLIQTNLIYGAYPIAEKYLDILENTLFYKSWAKSHRKFLYNDIEIENDPLLSLKRKSLPKTNYLSKIDGLDKDLQQLAENNPPDRTPIEYAGAIYLLLREIENFQAMIDTYYGTEILPVLPVSFQEAVIIFSEKNPDYRKRFNISETIMQRFDEFRKQMSTGKATPELLKHSHGDTYWYYYIFK